MIVQFVYCITGHGILGDCNVFTLPLHAWWSLYRLSLERGGGGEGGKGEREGEGEREGREGKR